MNKVWPKSTSFGSRAFSQVSNDLRGMLNCDTEQKWDLHYKDAKFHLMMDPRCQDILDEIFGNPNYYAGYILHKAEGSLGKQGDSHAEQNHSSIAASIEKDL